MAESCCGRMPTLEMINDRFRCRLLRGSLYNELRRAAVISVGSVQIVKFADYVRTLHLPTSLNLVKFNPLRGTGLIILDPTLVFALIDIYFGGKGRHAKIEGREFTAIENEIIANVLKETFRNLQEAWSHIAPLVIEKVGSEMNPHFANIVSPTEIVVVTQFSIDFDGVGGDLHVTMPYSMIEPLREVLDSGVQSDRVEQDDRWSLARFGTRKAGRRGTRGAGRPGDDNAAPCPICGRCRPVMSSRPTSPER